MSAIIAALAAGAGAIASGALSEAGKDAYKALKASIQRYISPESIGKLEQEPGSGSRKEIIAKELDQAGKADDPGLATLAQAVVDAVRKGDGGGVATGIALEEIEAINVRLKDIVASGPGVSIKKAKLAGDLEISGVTAGTLPGK